MKWQAWVRRAIEPLATSRHQVVLLIATLLVGGALSIVAARAVARFDTERERTRLERETAIITSRVDRHVSKTVNALEAVRPLWRIHNDPPREEIEVFLGRTEGDGDVFAGDVLAAIGFITALRPGQASDFLERRRADFPSDYTEHLDDDAPHYVVDYSVPNDLIGIDVYPLDQRRIALERARDTGQATATPWLGHLADLDKPPSQRRPVWALYLPVYSGVRTPVTTEARRAQIIGWLAATTSTDSMLDPMTADLDVQVALYDGSGPSRRLVAERNNLGRQAMRQTSELSVAGRQWTLEVAHPPAARVGALVAPWAVLTAGLLLTSLLAVQLWMLGRSHAQAERRARTATARMRVSDRSLRVLAEHLPIGVFDLGPDGRIRWVNSQMLEMLGVKRLDAPEINDLNRFIPTEDLQRVREELQRSTTQGEAVDIRHRLRATDGTERWVEHRSAPVIDEHGTVVRVVGSINDISAHLELQEALRQTRDVALHASRMKSEFLANMSHEIRTPLNGVIGMANLLLDGELTQEQRSRVITLRTAAHQLLGLLNDILDLSKIESGRIQLEGTSFDLADVIGQVLRLHASTAFDRGLELTSHISPDMPGTVIGDPLRIRQVLDNLLGNAVKFTEQGSVHFKVTAHRVGAGRVAVQFEVRDTGIGIPAEAQESVFRPFMQADTSTTRRFGGTGLGLSICAQLVELMGGELTVSSVVGEGSCFAFAVELGVERWEPTALAPVAPAKAVAPSSGRPHGQQRKLRVLLVEDNVINQQVALGLLAKLGHAVDVANDGAEALAAVSAAGEHGYDAILMDCQMPGMDGYEATRRIRSDEPEGRHTPIIALTAAAMTGDRDRCIAAGMDDYLSKPVSVTALDEALRQCLGDDTPDGGDGPQAGTTPPLTVAPVIDWATVRELATIGDLLQRSCERFVDDVPREIGELRAAVERDDFARAGQLAHKLKGSAATIGVARLAAHMSELEAALAQATDVLHMASDLLGHVDNVFDEAKQALLEAAARPELTAASPEPSG
jgi:hypothetical protein